MAYKDLIYVLLTPSKNYSQITNARWFEHIYKVFICDIIIPQILYHGISCYLCQPWWYIKTLLLNIFVKI